MELLDVPDNVLPYFDFEAYGRDMRINEGGHFAPTGYLTRSGDFKEVYHGIEDIPAEHRIFAYPKLISGSRWRLQGGHRPFLFGGRAPAPEEGA